MRWLSENSKFWWKCECLKSIVKMKSLSSSLSLKRCGDSLNQALNIGTSTFLIVLIINIEYFFESTTPQFYGTRAKNYAREIKIERQTVSKMLTTDN
jgi:hypothetical protein